MSEIHVKLRRLLDDSRLRKALAEAFYTGLDSPHKFIEMDLAEHIKRTRGEGHVGLSGDMSAPIVKQWIEGVPTRILEAFETHVINHMPAPSPITAEELASVAIAHLCGLPLADLDSEEVARAHRRFVAFAFSEVEESRWGNTAFDLGRWLCENEEEYDQVDFDNSMHLVEIWSSCSGFTLCAFAARWDWGTYVEMVAKFGAHCSELALARAEESLEQVIGSIVKTISLCLTRAERMNEKEQDLGYGRINYLVSGEGCRIVSSSLTAYFRRQDRSGEDTFLDRLRNATVLLSHADQAGADPIALSLSFAAIEALVCEKDEVGTTKQIKRHVATLLVGDPALRKRKENVVGNLYGIRSDVLHGTKISASSDASNAVRKIAAGVIRAVTCWRENQLRAGGETTWKELMDELNAASRKPGIVVGVPDLSELIPDKIPK